MPLRKYVCGSRVCRLASLVLVFAAVCCARPQEFLVSDFGAVGDGSRDDLPAVVLAVEAAAAAGGAVVRFPGGTYLWDGTLVLNRPGITLAGEAGAVIQATRSFQVLIEASGTHDIVLQQLHIVGLPEGTRGVTVQFRACVDCVVRDCTFERIGTSAINVTDGSQRCILERNQIRHAPGHGIMLSGYAGPGDPAEGSREIQILDNLLFRPGNTGISIEVHNEDVLVRGNQIIEANQNRELYSDGIAVFNGTSDFEISNNVILRTRPAQANDTGNGILLGQGEIREAPRYGLIRDNLLVENGRENGGQSCSAGDSCRGNGILTVFPDVGLSEIETRIEGNIIHGSGRSGISTGEARGLTIAANVIVGSGNQGIWLRESSSGLVVAGNTVWRSANHGIRVDSEGNRIVENWSGENGLSGIFLGPTASKNHVWGNSAAANDVASFGHGGIFVAGDSGVAGENRIQDNYVDGPGSLIAADRQLRDRLIRENFSTGVEPLPHCPPQSGEASLCRLIVVETGDSLPAFDPSFTGFLQVACGRSRPQSEPRGTEGAAACPPGRSVFLGPETRGWREVARSVGPS